MANKYQSKSDFASRKSQNKGVKHGTTKMGKGGRSLRTYNAKTARWEKTNPYGSNKKYTPSKPSGSLAKTTRSASRIGMDSITRMSGSGYKKPSSRSVKNRPSSLGKGGPTRLATNKSGERRWVKHVSPNTSWGSSKTSSFFDDPLNLKGKRNWKKPTTTTPSGQKIKWFKHL
jgi:hypothetical protein